MTAPFQLTNSVPIAEALLATHSWDMIERSQHSVTAELNGLSFDISWLGSASEQYQISANPEDYVYAQLRAMTLDLPNRNLYNFTLAEMKRYDPTYGCQVHKTFVGKPTYYQHEQVLPNAKGFILGSDLVNEGPYTYVVLTTAWDRTKDAKLAQRVLNVDTPAFFSMGCSAFQLVCSICGNVAPGKKYQCHHVKPPNRGTIVRGALAYEEARKIVFNEESLVEVPADSRASRMSDQGFQMEKGKILKPTI